MKSVFPDILAYSRQNLGNSVASNNFSVKVYIPLIQKDFLPHVDCLVMHVKEGVSVAHDLLIP